jgi:hypothetical protein
MQAYRIRLGQFEQRNGAHGQAGEVEAAPWRFVEAMTSRRLLAPWCADKIPGEALHAKVLTKDEARRIAVNIARLPAPTF